MSEGWGVPQKIQALGVFFVSWCAESIRRGIQGSSLNLNRSRTGRESIHGRFRPIAVAGLYHCTVA